MKAKVISLPYIVQVLCFTMPRYQVSVYRVIGPLVFIFAKIMDNGYSLEPPTIYVLSKNKEKYHIFASKNYHIYTQPLKSLHIAEACLRNVIV